MNPSVSPPYHGLLGCPPPHRAEDRGHPKGPDPDNLVGPGSLSAWILGRGRPGAERGPQEKRPGAKGRRFLCRGCSCGPCGGLGPQDTPGRLPEQSFPPATVAMGASASPITHPLFPTGNPASPVRGEAVARPLLAKLGHSKCPSKYDCKLFSFSMVGIPSYIGYISFIFLGRASEGEREGEKHRCEREISLSCYRSNLQPSHVP